MSIKNKIRSKFDDMFTFGFGLKYDSDVIKQAENQFQKDRDEFTPEERKKFEKILDELQRAKDKGEAQPPKGKDGGAVKKMKNGGTIGKTMPKTRSKPRVAGRLAMRGYGKAFKK